MKPDYSIPEIEIVNIGASRPFCQSPTESSLVYGTEKAPGGPINEDNYVDGGDY